MAIIEDKKNPEPEKKSEKKASKKTEIIAAIDNAEIARKVLIEPWITEKTHAAIADNKYTFRISNHATKKQVKAAIENVYDVHVEKITTVNLAAKRKAYGRYMGTKSAVRKATVTLKKGEKIELFKGA
jgi:large subunit ribosomal protein L23